MYCVLSSVLSEQGIGRAAREGGLYEAEISVQYAT